MVHSGNARDVARGAHCPTHGRQTSIGCNPKRRAILPSAAARRHSPDYVQVVEVFPVVRDAISVDVDGERPVSRATWASDVARLRTVANVIPICHTERSDCSISARSVILRGIAKDLYHLAAPGYLVRGKLRAIVMSQAKRFACANDDLVWRLRCGSRFCSKNRHNP